MDCSDLKNSAITDVAEDDTVCCVFVDVNKKQSQIHLKQSYNLAEIKQCIFNLYCDSLLPKRMNLYCNAQKMTDGPPLSTFLNLNCQQSPLIMQEKAELYEISCINASTSHIDQISYEQLTARLECGHYIGRYNLIDMIRKLIDMKRFRITCPYDNFESEKMCGKEIKFSTIKRIGALTRQECEEFETMLSLNYLSINTKLCPFCGSSISKEDLKTNRVTCVGCYSDDFCYRCLDKWITGDPHFCGNQTYKEVNNMLKNCPMSEKFILSKEDGNIVEINGPKYRSCPSCSELVEHKVGCKHMICTTCARQFCWVCLSVRPQNSQWTCQEPFDFCKPLAPPQCSEQSQ